MKSLRDKIVVIGAGFVGSTIAYAVMNAGFVSEIVLIDINKEKAEGEAMDLNHGASFVKPVLVKSGDYSECSDARVIIITAGLNQKPGETRLDLVKKNADIFKKIVPDIKDNTNESIILVVSNPVDILTYLTLKLSGFPRKQVIGSGTVLDTSRFRYLLSRKCMINPKNIHAYIIGEHGDHEVAAWSLTNIVGIPFEKYCKYCGESCSENVKKEIFEKVRISAYEVIKRKEATYYAIGLAVTRILESIFRNEHTILTVSSALKGEYGLYRTALSLPTMVGIRGIEKILALELAPDEKNSLVDSGGLLARVIEELNIEL